MILPCVILGDSLAVGMAVAMPECVSQSHVGISSAGFDKIYHGEFGLLTIISLGSNPGASDSLHLNNIRERIDGRVLWLLPASRDRDLISALAQKRGDLIVDSRSGGATPAHIHPQGSGYRKIADEILQIDKVYK